MAHPDRFEQPSHDGLVSLLAHDLRSPLAPISLAASWLAEDPTSTDEVRSLAKVADAQQDRLRRLIDAALVASGRMPVIRREDLVLGDVAGKAIDIHKSLGGEGDVVADDVSVHADPHLVRDALANLIECGAGEGGSVRVRVGRNNGHALAIVACKDLDAVADALDEQVPHDAMSALVLGSYGLLTLHEGGLELTDDGLVAWLPRV